MLIFTPSLEIRYFYLHLIDEEGRHKEAVILSAVIQLVGRSQAQRPLIAKFIEQTLGVLEAGPTSFILANVPYSSFHLSAVRKPGYFPCLVSTLQIRL